jgi:hypothetical protein
VDLLWTITIVALPITIWNMDSTLVFNSSCVVTWCWILWKIGSRWWWNPGKHHWTKHLAQELFFGNICCSGGRSVATTFCRNNGSWDVVFFVMWSLQTGISFNSIRIPMLATVYRKVIWVKREKDNIHGCRTWTHARSTRIMSPSDLSCLQTLVEAIIIGILVDWILKSWVWC